MEANGAEEGGASVREVFLYLCWGGRLEGRGNGELSYVGGTSDCVWITQGMRYDEVVKVVEATIEDGLRGRRILYSTKYDRKMLLPLQRDGDVGKLVKGNDEFGYMYVEEREVPIWKSVNVSEGGGNVDSTRAGQQSGGCRSEAVATVGDSREPATVTR